MLNKKVNLKFLIVFVLIPLALILGITAIAKNAPLGLSSPSPTAGLAVNATINPEATATKINPPATNAAVEQYSNGSCHSVNGEPDPVCTPGAANPNVTQANIYSTICVSGYTTTIRPSTTYTNNLKTEQIREYGYADTNLSDYEEDHLIPLEVGGDPTNPKNLWPEYGKIPNPKDSVENLCHAKVCNGQIGLVEAQREIATDWHTACGGSSTTTQNITPTTAPASPPQTNTATQGNGATALCNDGTYSYAANHQGACSHHGGVAVFYK